MHSYIDSSVEFSTPSHLTRYWWFWKRYFYTSSDDQPTVSKHRRRVVSHLDSSKSHQAHLTMLQCVHTWKH